MTPAEQVRGLVFNAVSRALIERDRWVPLNVRMAVTEEALAALADAGMVVVSAEDLRTYLNRDGSDLRAEVEALRRLRAALPGRSADA